MSPEEFKIELKTAGIDLSEQQIWQFAQYFLFLTEWNKKINLTAIDHSEIYLKHFFDSLAPLLLGLLSEKKKLKLIDVGSGAGFPSIPLLIIRPDLKITIVDSLNKRINFLRELSKELDFKENIQFQHARAEDLGQDKDFREQYDIAVARAVAKMELLCELTLPFLKQGGQLFAFKGPNFKEEVRSSQKAREVLGGKLKMVYEYELPKNHDARSIVVMEKVTATPAKYPRKPGMSSKKPIV